MIPHNIPEAMFAHRDLARAMRRSRFTALGCLIVVGAPLVLLCGVGWLIHRLFF